MKRLMFFALSFLVFSCQDEGKDAVASPDAAEQTATEKTPAAEELTIQKITKYFYHYDTIPKIYVYRDVIGGLNEQFHRVYAIKDQEGKHIIVEVYSSDFRLTEALNYNYATLNVQDHMVVNRNQEKTKADLIKNAAFPFKENNPAELVSRFPGHLDSTIIVKEIKRTPHNETKKEIEIMNKKISFYSFYDQIKMSLLNPFSKKQETLTADQISKFGEGIGLVEWHSTNKKAYFRLEKIINQKKWLEIRSSM